MKVVIADMRKKAIDEVLPFFKERAVPVHGIELDVTDREAYVKAADEAEAVFGKITFTCQQCRCGGSQKPNGSLLIKT
jgi:NAD(P)-dependent dehydrogenase (short-subunit alcohol dehydrogenase family)